MASDLNQDALAHWLRTNIPDRGELLTIERLAGGQSNPTYRLRTDGGDLVLRRKPFGDLLPSAHAIEREFEVFSALSPLGYPVPRPIALCTDAAVVGAAFYLMAFVEGRVFWDGALPELQPSGRRAVYEAMVDALARLHRVPVKEAGLQLFGHPGNYFTRQVARWTRQYRASQTEPSPEMDRLIEFLAGSVPAQARTSIIHGDYRLDNVVFREGTLDVAAVLDWELSTLGDPIADFAYFALNWAMPYGLRPASIGGLDLPALGIPTLDELTDRYCSATGVATRPQLDWYFAFNLFRGVSIAQGIRRRSLDGNAAGEDAAAAVANLPELIEAALQFAGRAGLNASTIN